MVVTAIATEVETSVNRVGSFILILLIAALIVKEIAGHSGNARYLPLAKGMNIAILPLSIATGFVLVHQLAAIGS